MSEIIQPSTADSPGRWFSRNWLSLFLLVWGVFNLLPWLAFPYLEKELGAGDVEA
jgi:hypothetical protein